MQRLAQAPATPIVLCGVLVLGWFATQDAGYEIRTWAPGGAILIALVLLGVALVPNPWKSLPRSTVAAGALLAGYCAWSYASVAWAADPGSAWLAANRTVVYLAAFVLFAAWRQRPATAGLLLGAWTGVVSVLAAVVVARLLTTDDARTLLPDGRLLYPAGYANAAAALLLMAAFGALTCAAGRSPRWWLRGLAAGATVLLVGVAVLAVSRGSLLATPICLVILLCVFPGRLRRLAALLPIGAAVAYALPKVIEATDAVGGYQPPPGVAEARAAGEAILLGVIIVAVVVGAAALLEERRPASARTARRFRLAGAVAATAGTLAIIVAAVVVTGNPVARAESTWSSFKGGYSEYSGNRLSSGLGSNRYDFYRVALAGFRERPLAGAGADNYYETYLREGRSDETPRFPHSLELRTLSQTGLIGALLLFGAMAAALPAALRAARGRASGEAGQVVATGALLAFTYWVVHGSADWFFEYAGLGAAAFGLLGLACSLDPARRVDPGQPPRARDGLPRPVVLAAVGLAAVVPALALLSQWTADREVSRAGAVFATRSGEAYERLDRARSLNPFSDTPDSVAGSIAMRLGDPFTALTRFRAALERSPDDQYDQLQVGAALSALGLRAAARQALERAVALAPREPLAREALAIVKAGGSIDPKALSSRVLATSDPGG